MKQNLRAAGQGPKTAVGWRSRDRAEHPCLPRGVGWQREAQTPHGSVWLPRPRSLPAERHPLARTHPRTSHTHTGARGEKAKNRATSEGPTPLLRRPLPASVCVPESAAESLPSLSSSAGLPLLPLSLRPSVHPSVCLSWGSELSGRLPPPIPFSRCRQCRGNLRMFVCLLLFLSVVVFVFFFVFK